MAWGIEDVPDQRGRTVVITGANSGLGLEAAKVFASKGATVVLACRRPAAAAEAIASIRRQTPDAAVETLALDLASLASIRAAATTFSAKHARLDVLLNNAGIMAIPRQETADGFEMQLGTNHLGHFALTGLLVDRLLATPGSRVVNVSSGMHFTGTMDFADLHGRARYSKWGAYGQSKLANLLFTSELAKRLEARGAKTLALAAHPGYAATNLQAVGPKLEGHALLERAVAASNAIFAQSAFAGALPLVRAAVDPTAKSNDYFGPGPLGYRGAPVHNGRSSAAKDRKSAVELWLASERETGVSYLD